MHHDLKTSGGTKVCVHSKVLLDDSKKLKYKNMHYNKQAHIITLFWNASSCEALEIRNEIKIMKLISTLDPEGIFTSTLLWHYTIDSLKSPYSEHKVIQEENKSVDTDWDGLNKLISTSDAGKTHVLYMTNAGNSVDRLIRQIETGRKMISVKCAIDAVEKLSLNQEKLFNVGITNCDLHLENIRYMYDKESDILDFKIIDFGMSVKKDCMLWLVSLFPILCAKHTDGDAISELICSQVPLEFYLFVLCMDLLFLPELGFESCNEIRRHVMVMKNSFFVENITVSIDFLKKNTNEYTVGSIINYQYFFNSIMKIYSHIFLLPQINCIWNRVCSIVELAILSRAFDLFDDFKQHFRPCGASMNILTTNAPQDYVMFSETFHKFCMSYYGKPDTPYDEFFVKSCFDKFSIASMKLHFLTAVAKTSHRDDEYPKITKKITSIQKEALPDSCE